MRFFGLGAAMFLTLASCGPADPPEVADVSNPAPRVDEALIALQRAHPNNCPAERTIANARSGGFGDQEGVTIDDVASVPMQSGGVLTLQRVTVVPGGVIGWHAHDGGQGMALLVTGEVIEARNNCLDTIAFKPGDITLEDASLVHAFRNDGEDPAVFLVWGGAPADQ